MASVLFYTGWEEILKAFLFILIVGIGAVVLQGFDAMLATAAQPLVGSGRLPLQAVPQQPAMSAEALVHLSRTDPNAYYQYLNNRQGQTESGTNKLLQLTARPQYE